jgi:hypothetical protein
MTTEEWLALIGFGECVYDFCVAPDVLQRREDDDDDVPLCLISNLQLTNPSGELRCREHGLQVMPWPGTRRHRSPRDDLDPRSVSTGVLLVAATVPGSCDAAPAEARPPEAEASRLRAPGAGSRPSAQPAARRSPRPRLRLSRGREACGGGAKVEGVGATVTSSRRARARRSAGGSRRTA